MTKTMEHVRVGAWRRGAIALAARDVAAEAAPTPISPGTIEVRARVTLTAALR